MIEPTVAGTEGEPERRQRVLAALLAGLMTGAEAAAELGLSVRQVRRLAGALRRRGPAGLVHGNRGRASPRRLPDDVRLRIADLARTTYAGLSRTALAERLHELERIEISASTLRRVLTAAGVESAYRRRPRRLPPSAMPVSFDLGRRRVELLDLRGADFHEPFFHQTVERWRRERPNALSLELDLDAFQALARLEPGRQPDGFIFHVGRCGSTLLANMLSALDRHLVIKESTAVNVLVNGLVSAPDEARRRERESLLVRALPFMLRPARGTERYLLFKLTSWNMCLSATMLRLFPNTPAAFLYRECCQTVASMLSEPSGWQSLRGRPRAVQARYFPSLATVPPDQAVSPATFYAHAWRSGVAAALALPAERLLVLEYGDLVGAPDATLARLMRHFRLEPEPGAVAQMCRALSVYSKDPAGRTAFDPAGTHRRPTLEQATESEVAAVVGDLAAALEARHAADAERYN